MSLKVCTICKIEKKISLFNKNKSKSDGLQTHCKVCSKERFKKYYDSNREKHVATITIRKKKQVVKLQNFICSYLKEHPCVDCDEKDIIVLDFDHLKDKEENVSRLISLGISLRKLKFEIEKCVVRCANCHRRKTAKDYNYYRFRSVNEEIMEP